MKTTDKMRETPLLSIDYEKYLNCIECKKKEFYCKKHLSEVETFLTNQGSG